MTEVLSSIVGGKPAAAGGTYDVTSPATGRLLAHVEEADDDVVDRAVASARETFTRTRLAGLAERVGWCERVEELIHYRATDLARELAEEHGKPLHEALDEVRAGARGFRLAGEWVRALDGGFPPVEDRAKRVIVFRQPRGVWAILTPWNFPFNIPIEYLGPAVATGSPVVWKPAPTCARIASRLVALMQDAGLPDGLVNLVQSPDPAVARYLVSHPGIDAVGLTGGSRTGDAVARAAWDKHLLLELGGNGPFVVLDDADLDRAAHAVRAAAFTNAGQVCSAAGRVLVSEGVADELSGALVELASGIVLGPPDLAGVTMGPVHTEAVAATMDRHVADAVGQGAVIRFGGGRVGGHGTSLFYAPTVLDHVPASAAIAREETFGPVAPLIRVAGDDNAILDLAKQGEHGLVAAVFTRSLDRAWQFAEGLETGSVVVNDSSTYWELHLPFGGRAGRSSGRGRLGGRSTIEEFTQTKTVSFHIGS